MQYLVGADSVHTTAAACDYLEGRMTAEDAVAVVGVVPSDPVDGEPTRLDLEEAMNVASVRLVDAGTVETTLVDGAEPATALRDRAAAWDVDEIVIGPHRGSPEAEGVGSTCLDLLENARRPVVVVPAPTF
ncbi:universal stress protein [Natrialbaceae archaeon GCM10025810]|uniref:universal stress protein n=1 Tax=Halovalidus salilacus TaxID=3075124 RepID=UPI0036137A83